MTPTKTLAEYLRTKTREVIPHPNDGMPVKIEKVIRTGFHWTRKGLRGFTPFEDLTPDQIKRTLP